MGLLALGGLQGLFGWLMVQSGLVGDMTDVSHFRLSLHLLTALALLAGLAMVGVVWWWRDAFIAIPILIGAVTYLSLIALLRVVPAEDITLARNFVQQMINRIRRRRTKPVNAGETVSMEGAYAGND